MSWSNLDDEFAAHVCVDPPFGSVLVGHGGGLCVLCIVVCALCVLSVLVGWGGVGCVGVAAWKQLTRQCLGCQGSSQCDCWVEVWMHGRGGEGSTCAMHAVCHADGNDRPW